MKLLLDTHIMIWALFDLPYLSDKARALICDPRSQVYVSLASLWEVAIKYHKSPDKMPFSEDLIDDLCDNAGFGRFNIRTPHILALHGLSRTAGAPAHHDPFDRILLAQAMAEGATLLTHDKRLAEYGEDCVMLV